MKKIIIAVVAFVAGMLAGQLINVKLQDRARAKFVKGRTNFENFSNDSKKLAEDEESAKEVFAKAITIDCPIEDCGKKVGELCDTPALWVHADRIILTGF